MLYFNSTNGLCKYITTPDPDFALFSENFSKKMKKANRYG